jgi:hypothetical protein
MMRSRRIATALSLLVGAIATLGAGASPALAETHPFVSSFGAFTNPNGIAVEESTGDVYVADIGTDTVSKFDANGNSVDFSALHSNTLTGIDTPAKSFSFPEVYGTPAQVAVDNSTDPTDPSRGDLYVMDLGHDVIDKFSPSGEYLSQITGPFEEGLVGFALTANGDVHVALLGHGHIEELGVWQIDLFDNSTTNNFITQSYVGGGFNENGQPEHSFAAGPTGDYYGLLAECGCAEKFGSTPIGLGRVDSGPGDVAMAVDPMSGHLYVDEQSSIVEWDTGGMDGHEKAPDSQENVATAAFVSNFGLGELSPVLPPREPQGGIAVNGVTGDIYVSNPADGKVYVFANTPPAVAAGTATNVSETGATLQGSIDPRGVPVTSCEFEYEKAPQTPNRYPMAAAVTAFAHKAQCAQTAARIGSGTSPVGVSAEIPGGPQPPLEAGSLYYFRLVAGNAGATNASEGMFATVNSGFGISSFGVSFLNEDGTPDTQAGSHPYEMVTNFAFKTKAERQIANTDSPYELIPAGNAKDIIVDPPPGLVGNPNATETKCTFKELGATIQVQEGRAKCQPGSQVGTLTIETGGEGTEYGSGTYGLYNMVPPRGVAAQFGTLISFPRAFIDVGLKTGEQYPLQAESLDIPAIEPLFTVSVKLFGVVGKGENRKPFLTLPTGCTGPLTSTIEADSYQAPGHFVSKSEVTRNASGEPVVLTGCSKLTFPPAITVAPDVSDASSPSGLTVGVHVPQTAAFNPNGLAESSLRDTTVALPAGVAINPAGAGGLQACSEALAGFTGFREFNPEFEAGVKTFAFTSTPIEALQPGVSLCPDASKIATVKIKTPLLPNPLEGAVYLAEQNNNPFKSLIAMYMLIEDPVSGSTVKLAGEVRLCESTGEVVDGMTCQVPGQIITTFENTPDLPFEELELHFFGGERAPLTTPSRCGTYTTQAIFTPWNGIAPVETSSSFQITSGPNGSPCPGARLPFNPSLTGGSTNIQAGSFTPLTGTFGREDGEQEMARLRFTLPPGLSGLLTGIKLCPEAQANAGTCGPESLIGETTVSAGVGSDPVSVEGGKVYLTEKYHGAPFGLSVVDPVKAGPFDLERDTANPNQDPACDCIVVRAKIEIDPLTAALTITSNSEGEGYAIPHFIDGVPVQIKRVNFVTTRHEFQFNPTSCAKMAIAGSVESDEGESHAVEVPFQVTNCARLGFKPRFTVSTSGKTSRARGASLTLKVTRPSGPGSGQANFAKVKVDLPKQLPSRLTTLQKACVAAQFNRNPAGCPAASIIGHARVLTPILPVPLEGPAYFVSHGGEAFPNLIMVLQGYGVTLDVISDTFISKAGITSGTLNVVPDAPFTSFELTLPQGKDSALAANGNLCKSKLAMPTAFVAQNGAEIHESTPIGVTGCPRAKKAKAKGKHHKDKRK